VAEGGGGRRFAHVRHGDLEERQPAIEMRRADAITNAVRRSVRA
jgi:hypothetical protein